MLDLGRWAHGEMVPIRDAPVQLGPARLSEAEVEAEVEALGAVLHP